MSRMRLLVLGGTGFVGRHITEAALDAGHDVTVFNRGRTNADLFPGATRLTGDREAVTILQRMEVLRQTAQRMIDQGQEPTPGSRTQPMPLPG